MPHGTRRRVSRVLLVVFTLTFTMLAPAAALARASALHECPMSLRDHEPPGRTPAYAVRVFAAGTPCALAKRVMRAFHACRGVSGRGCTRPLLGSWRCSSSRSSALRYFDGALACTSRGRRMRGTYRQDTPACFGAAARDPKLACGNDARSLPQPSLEPDPFAECDPGDPSGVCASGVLSGTPARRVALVGDSHTTHWRAPLNVVANVLNWRVHSLFAGGCFYSAVVTRFLEGCGRFYSETTSWLTDHPEVDTVFMTQNADTPVSVEEGETIFEAKVAGAREAYAHVLPKSVKHVIVLRDLTISTSDTMDCVSQASSAATQPLANGCPLARSVALRPDPAVEAVRRLHARRYAAIDLSRYQCDTRWCYPVVGGTLVNADVWGHLNTVFARTLAPYLLRALYPLMARWDDR